MASITMRVRRAGLLLVVCTCALLAACGNDDGGSGPTPTPTPVVTPPPSRHAQFVTDDQGRALILHGVNVSSSAKDDPLRSAWITRADAERVRRDWGLNSVRLLIFWDALEPTPGHYDEAYLDRVAERVSWFADAGVYVILDMHQDVWGHLDEFGRSLGFDGAPSWASITDGLPHRIANPWALTYIQPGVKRVFDNFWGAVEGHPELREHYIAAWAHVAGRFRDHPSVLGYDLMNEPFAGSSVAGDLGGFQFGDPEVSKQFEQTLFREFYQRCIAGIRAVDPDGWIFYEPLAFPANNGGPSYIGKLDDPREGEDRLVYFPHLYAILPELHGNFDPNDTPEMDAWNVARSAEVEEAKTPMMIGEFGMPWDSGGDPLMYLQKMLNLADEMTSGWQYWTYDPGNWAPVTGDDRHESPNANILTRSYPMRVAGTPIEYAYDPQTRVLDLTFFDRDGVSGATEIYIPARRFYGQGWNLEVSDASGTWSSQWDADAEVLSLTTPRTGGLHQVRVSPR